MTEEQENLIRLKTVTKIQERQQAHQDFMCHLQELGVESRIKTQTGRLIVAQGKFGLIEILWNDGPWTVFVPLGNRKILKVKRQSMLDAANVVKEHYRHMS